MANPKELYQKVTNQDSFKVGIAVGIMFFLAEAIKEILKSTLELFPKIPTQGVTIVTYLITTGLLLWWFSSLVNVSKK